MLFNSFAFAIFLPIVITVYYLLANRLKAQNVWLLLVSYFFYAWWDWHFLWLLAGATIVAFSCAAGIARTTIPVIRRAYLFFAIAINLVVLGFFKYFDFFQQNLIKSLSTLGISIEPYHLNLVLPIGISFFVFQGLSYVVDVYRNDTKPVTSFLDFAVFKAFFPQLVAGPIERAGHMMPQFQTLRRATPEQFASGIYLLILGLFKKIVIADNLADISNPVFNDYASQPGADLLLGMLAFTFQIYCDFSGYTDIARGVARIMGIELMINFNLPNFATNPSEFWRRWHISLSQWLRDYVYIPLGGGRASSIRVSRNLMATMLLGGLWHGAAWNFVAWGAYHGGLLIMYRGVQNMCERFGLKSSRASLPWRIALMFILTVIGWVLFRATSLDQVFYMLSHVGFATSGETQSRFLIVSACIVPLYLFELVLYMKPSRMDLPFRSVTLQAIFNAVLICVMLVCASRVSSEFIYFDF